MFLDFHFMQSGESGGTAAALILRPDNDTEAVVHGLGRGRGETVRVVNTEGGERLKYSGYDLRRSDIEQVSRCASTPGEGAG
ncbi:MAG TPA: hypothetical protein ENJ19_01825 [Gammaproteobacteria bacterium]|nr:hypothetical protein [Gammaproteobacteria bacterium]